MKRIRWEMFQRGFLLKVELRWDLSFFCLLVTLIEANGAGRCGFQRLKAAVHYTVGRLCRSIGEERRAEFSRQTVAAIAETVVRQCGGWQSAQQFNKLLLIFFWRIDLLSPTTVTLSKLTAALLCSKVYCRHLRMFYAFILRSQWEFSITPVCWPASHL